MRFDTICDYYTRRMDGLGINQSRQVTMKQGKRRRNLAGHVILTRCLVMVQRMTWNAGNE